MHEASHGGEGTIIQANLEDLLRDKREVVGILEGNEDEDDTRNQYCSDDSNCGGRDHMSRGDDDLWEISCIIFRKTCIIELHFSLDFWLCILNMFGMLSCYKLVLQRTHRLCPPVSILHYADCLLCT